MNPLKRVGRYELDACLGGGMAWVYRARDTIVDRTVVVRILKDTNDDVAAKCRFLREAKVAARMAHENIVRVYDFGQDDESRPYIVMEYIPGQDLGKAVKSGSIGDLESKLRIAVQIASALSYP